MGLGTGACDAREDEEKVRTAGARNDCESRVKMDLVDMSSTQLMYDTDLLRLLMSSKRGERGVSVVQIDDGDGKGVKWQQEDPWKVRKVWKVHSFQILHNRDRVKQF